MHGLLIYAAFAAAMLLAPMLGIWPTLRRGRAFNAAWRIDMPDPATTYGERWLSVYAQEIVEWWAAWAVALIVAAPAAYLLDQAVPMLGAVAIVVAQLIWLWRTTPPGRRQLEYLGWAATWVWAQRTGVDQGRFDSFVERMAYLVFAEIPLEHRIAAVRRRLPIARLLVTLLTLNIRRAV